MLRDGKSTPDFVESMLSVFGNNPHGLPNYRLIWSERKMIYFAGEWCPEYRLFARPRWIVETWTAPEVDGGTPEVWERTTFGMLGPYPTQGTYNLVEDSLRVLPVGWEPTEEAVRLLCVALVQSKDLSMKERVRGIRENKEEEAAAARQKVADEIVELQDSGSRGLVQQSVSGPKNNFRTVDDFVRDMERSIAVKDLPKTGGKIY